jgi:ferritin-like metal-binding protein YciE
MSTNEFVDWLILAILGGFVAVLKWSADRLHRRVDELEKSKAEKDAISDLKKDFHDHREETRSQLSAIQNSINQILLRRQQ